MWLAIGLVLLTLALYWPVHGYDFVNYDDVDYVRQNAPVRAGLTPASLRWAFTTLHAGFWIPLTWLSFMADAQLYGPNAGGYHVTNLLLHAANTLLLFALLSRSTGAPWASALVAGLFTVHPLHVESVAWVTERKDVLSTLFLLLTLWSYGRYVERRTPRRYAGTLAVFTLGLMAKPMLTTLPLLLLLLDLWPLGRFTGLPPARLVLEKVPFLVLAVGAGLLTMIAGNHIVASAPLAGVDVWPRLANACESTVLYLVQTVWPSGLAPLYPDPGSPPAWRAALAAIALAVTTGVAIRMADRRPWVATGWLWYLIALLPVSGLVRIGPFVMADRFTYVPLLGIFVLVAWGGRELATRWPRQALAATAVLALAALTVAARLQLAFWRDGVTLFERTIAVTGPNPVAQHLLGLALADQNRGDEAMAHHAEAVRLIPGYARAHTSLGLLLADRGRPDEAIAHFEAALRADPNDPYAHSGLANTLLGQGRTADAMAHFSAALRIDPTLVQAHTSYGKALAAAGRVDEANAHYAVALRLDPDDADAHNNLANALADQGRVDEAMAHYGAALRIRPTHATAHANFAIFLAEHGRFQEAADHYAAALRLRPGDARIRADLGNALAAQGRLDDAVVQYTEALRLEPGYAGAHNNLGNALAMLGRVDESIAHYEEALRLDPQYADVHYNLGMLLADRGRTEEAIAHYAAAVRIRPVYPDAHTQLGIALQKQGRAATAREHFAEALRQNPGDATARRHLEVAGTPP